MPMNPSFTGDGPTLLKTWKLPASVPLTLAGFDLHKLAPNADHYLIMRGVRMIIAEEIPICMDCGTGPITANPDDDSDEGVRLEMCWHCRKVICDVCESARHYDTSEWSDELNDWPAICTLPELPNALRLLMLEGRGGYPPLKLPENTENDE